MIWEMTQNVSNKRLKQWIYVYNIYLFCLPQGSNHCKGVRRKFKFIGPIE